MTAVLYGVAFVLMLSIVAGLVRVERGPTAADRMLVAQLFGTTGVAVLLLLAEAMRIPSLRDVSLVFALLAVMAAVAFVKRAWRARSTDEGGGR
ncbi:MAG TPA: monovalent cation/H+ antiporter complex subunit F [Coriobacteriia bacterium]|nr:monovalent cation/H+ antiporter complex subunit F [Coriobacteriia bacterium]